ncbi:SDR family oxidoreductase [uncultured Arcticibacterium sp.]|uniref:SDR family oxidoreductase n=1 Tax=uncultured Arcticibacterium sp. TaxID=2173042 RepID=UPI0030F8C87D
MILVTGATGVLGNGVIENLLKTTPANKIAALVRDESKAANLKEKGVNIRVGSYQDKDALATAMKGINRVLLISSSDFNDRIGQHKNVIDAAKDAEVKHIFYTSVSIEDMDNSPIKPLLGDHFETENYIKGSGLTYTFLRNNLYQEVVPMFVGENVLETGIFFPSGEGKVAFVSRADLAEATAIILTGKGYDNKIIALTGSQAYSYAEIAKELSKFSEKEVAFTSPEPSVFSETLKGFGLPAHIVQMSSLFAAGIKNKDFETTSNDLENLLGREPKKLTNFLREVYGK